MARGTLRCTAQTPSNEGLLLQLLGAASTDALSCQPLQGSPQLERAISLKGLGPSPGGHNQWLNRDLTLSLLRITLKGHSHCKVPHCGVHQGDDWPAPERELSLCPIVLPSPPFHWCGFQGHLPTNNFLLNCFSSCFLRNSVSVQVGPTLTTLYRRGNSPRLIS